MTTEQANKLTEMIQRHQTAICTFECAREQADQAWTDLQEFITSMVDAPDAAPAKRKYTKRIKPPVQKEPPAGFGEKP